LNKTVKETGKEVQENSVVEWKTSPFFPHSRFCVLLHDCAFLLLLLTYNSVSGIIQSSSTRSTCRSIHLISSVQFLNYYTVAVLCFSRNSMTSTPTSIILLLFSHPFWAAHSSLLIVVRYFCSGVCAVPCQHNSLAFSTK
jgi:hypothetical protein